MNRDLYFFLEDCFVLFFSVLNENCFLICPENVLFEWSNIPQLLYTDICLRKKKKKRQHKFFKTSKCELVKD